MDREYVIKERVGMLRNTERYIQAHPLDDDGFYELWLSFVGDGNEDKNTYLSNLAENDMSYIAFLFEMEKLANPSPRDENFVIKCDIFSPTYDNIWSEYCYVLDLTDFYELITEDDELIEGLIDIFCAYYPLKTVLDN